MSWRVHAVARTRMNMETRFLVGKVHIYCTWKSGSSRTVLPPGSIVHGASARSGRNKVEGWFIGGIEERGSRRHGAAGFSALDVT
jgi:hypothetical protein